MRQEGHLTQWNDAKGYGFITPKGGGARLFVHIRAFSLRAQRPTLGEPVSFEPGTDAQGKARALHVRGLAPVKVSKAAPVRPASPAAGNASVWLVPGFAIFYLLADRVSPVPPAVWGAYMTMSMATYIVYWGDKRAARLGRSRVPERTLHLLSLACGWPGALLARQTLRHKSAKPVFSRIFWLTVILNWLGFTLLALHALL